MPVCVSLSIASLLSAMRETGADVPGLDWPTPLGETWKSLDYSRAVQGSLDPITLFAEPELIRERVKQVLTQTGAGRDISSTYLRRYKPTIVNRPRLSKEEFD